MYPRVWGAGGVGSNSGFAECCSGLLGYSRQSGLPEVPWSADLEQESLWGGGGLQSWLHAELCGLCPSVLTMFLSLSSGLGSF